MTDARLPADETSCGHISRQRPRRTTTFTCRSFYSRSSRQPDGPGIDSRRIDLRLMRKLIPSTA